MTNEEKAKELSDIYMPDTGFTREDIYDTAMEMAGWKDEQLWLLIDAIDHAYLQTNGTYGELSYEVSDRVNYLKQVMKGE